MAITYKAYWLRVYKEAHLLNTSLWQQYTQPLEASAIRRGQIDVHLNSVGADDASQTQINVMIAPFCAMNDKGEYLAPIFLPAILKKDGSLLPRYQGIQPFIPTHFFSEGVLSPKFGQLLHYDNYLNSQAQLQAPISASDWQSFYIRGYHCLNDLANDWEEKFSVFGYQKCDHGLIYRVDTVEDAVTKALESDSPLLARYLNPYSEEEYQEESSFFDTQVFQSCLGLAQPYPLSTNKTDTALQAFLSTLAINAGDIYPIKLPRGCSAASFLDNVIASERVHALLDENIKVAIIGQACDKPLPFSWLLNTHTDELSLTKNLNHFKDKFFGKFATQIQGIDEAISILQSKFEQSVETYTKAVEHFIQWETQGLDKDLQAQLDKLSSEDEDLESEYTQLESALDIWNKKGNSHPWWMGLSFISSIKKKKEARFKAFVSKCLIREDSQDAVHWTTANDENVVELIQNRLRTIRTRRTKIHVEMVPITDTMISNNTHAKAFFGLLFKSTKGSKASVDILYHELNELRLEIAQLATHYQEARWLAQPQTAYIDGILKFTNIQVFNEWCLEHSRLDTKSDGGSLFDKVILFETNQYLPFELAPLLTHTQKLICIGDALSKEPVYPIPGFIDEDYAHRYQLLEAGFDFEVLQFKGGVCSSSNAFMLSIDCASFKHTPESHLLPTTTSMLNECQLTQNIGAYLNEHIYGSALNISVNKSIDTSTLIDSGSTIEFVHVNGFSQCFGGNFYNNEEALAVVQWIANHQHKLENIRVISPFAYQIELIKTKLHEKNIKFDNLFTLEQVPFEPCEQVLFSSVLNPKDDRPFCFDQGEQSFNVAVSSAKSSFVLFGDMNIFNEDTHSPSGNVAKWLQANGKKVDLSIPLPGESFEPSKANLSRLLNKAQSEVFIFSEKIAKDFLKRLDITDLLGKIKKQEVSCHIITAHIDSSCKKQLLHLGFDCHIVAKMYDNILVVDNSTYINFASTIFADNEEVLSINQCTSAIRRPKHLVKELKEHLLQNLSSLTQKHFGKNYSTVES